MSTLQARFLLFVCIVMQFLPSNAGAATVTNCDEASLRAAMAEGGTVAFACDGIIPLSAPLVVELDTVLDASGRQIILDGGGSVRLIRVPDFLSLSIRHITLANGKSTNGGAVYNAGRLEAWDCTFTGNTVVGWLGPEGLEGYRFAMPAEGGAIWNGGSAMLQRCKFSDNTATGIDALGNLSASGGAICNRGELFVSDCTIGTNSTRGGNGIWYGLLTFPKQGGNGKGGALYNAGSAVVLNSTFAANTSSGGAGNLASRDPWIPGGNGGMGSGGAIANEGSIAFTNCTFFGNWASGGAGGMPYQIVPGGQPGQSAGGAVDGSAGLLTLAFCTLGSNSATSGGAIHSVTGSCQILQSIVAGSTSGGNASGPIEDLGYNISSDASLLLTNTGSLSMTDPMLGPLAYNGGPTLTMRLKPGSPAIDAGAVSTGPFTDQRGFQRSIGSRSDIGALENAAIPLRIVIGFAPTITPSGSVVSLSLNITNLYDFPVTGIRISNLLSSALSVSTEPIITNGFNGSVTAVPGRRSVVLSGFSLAPLAGCTIRLPIAANQVGLASNTLTGLQSDQFGSQLTPGIVVTLNVSGAAEFRLLSFLPAGPQTIRLRGIGPPSTVFRLQISEDLSQWTSEDMRTTGADGLFEFDVSAPGAGARFIRTVSP